MLKNINKRKKEAESINNRWTENDLLKFAQKDKVKLINTMHNKFKKINNEIIPSIEKHDYKILLSMLEQCNSQLRVFKNRNQYRAVNDDFAYCQNV